MISVYAVERRSNFLSTALEHSLPGQALATRNESLFNRPELGLIRVSVDGSVKEKPSTGLMARA